MQGSKRDTDVKNRLLDSGRRQEWDDLREYHWNMYITVCEIDDQSKFDAWNRALKASALGQPRGMGREQGSGEGDTCTPMADSYQCMAKTTTTILWSNEPPIKINFLKKDSNNFISNTIMLPALKKKKKKPHSLLSVQWSFPEAQWWMRSQETKCRSCYETPAVFH